MEAGGLVVPRWGNVDTGHPPLVMVQLSPLATIPARRFLPQPALTVGYKGSASQGSSS